MSWINTYSGKKFDLLELTEEILIGMIGDDTEQKISVSYSDIEITTEVVAQKVNLYFDMTVWSYCHISRPVLFEKYKLLFND